MNKKIIIKIKSVLKYKIPLISNIISYFNAVINLPFILKQVYNLLNSNNELTNRYNDLR